MALCRCAFGRELRERYKEMAEMYWRCNSAPVSCAGQLDHYERGKFFTVGLEGFGHHAFFHTPKSLGATGGGARSYPFGFTWRNEGYASIPASYRGPDLPELLMQNKLLVLVRDLVDAHFSTVRRFWKEKTRLLDSLDLELRAAIDNLRLMRDTVGNVRPISFSF